MLANSIFERISQNCCVFDVGNCRIEGSLAEKHFQLPNLNEVSQASFAFNILELADTQTDRPTDRQTKTDSQPARQEGRQADRPTYRQTDRKIDR